MLIFELSLKTNDMKITEYKEKGFLKSLGKHYKEFDIEGCSDIRRAKVPHNIKVGEGFNIYRGESTKEGCIWKGDLERSLIAHIGTKMNIEEMIINKALGIVKANFMEYPDFDEEQPFMLADALTVIIMEGENHDTEMESDKVYDLIDGLIEGNSGKVTYRIADLDQNNNGQMFHPTTFHDKDEALKVLDKEYTNRNKDDGHDDYWKNRKTGLQKVTTLTELVFVNKK